ncbi:MAG: hypothetical protein IJP17_04520 [Clostridia bacterium]|nr:hypothetical protein [Clostridia bacterium]
MSEFTVGSVALLDGCTDGRATRLLGECSTISYDMGDVLSKQCDLPDATYWGDDGFLVMSHPNDDSAFSVASVRSMFDSARQLFDYCVFDCPSGSFARIGAIAASADMTIICTRADEFDLSAAARLRRVLPEQDRCCRLLVTRYSISDLKRGFVQNIDDCIDTVKARLIGIVPADSRLEHIALDDKLPGDTIAMKAMGNVAARVLGKNVPLMDF